MKVYLINLDGGRYVFYSEGPETAAEAEPVAPRTGMRGWAERRYKSLQALLNESEKGVGLRVRRVWERLKKRIPPDEHVLRSLRGARAVKLYHPPTFSEEEARKVWHDYLKNRQGRHGFWFVADALVSPLTLVFAPLPGPNVVGYWFVYRSVCHLLARLGARNGRSDEVTTAFHSIEELESSLGPADDERIASLSSNFGLPGLDAFVKRTNEKMEKARRKTPLPVS